MFDWWYLVSSIVYLIIVSVICVYILWYFTYKLPLKINPFVYAVAFISFFLNFSMIALVTIDLSTTVFVANELPEGETVKQPLPIVIVWYVIYWTIQVLSWCVIPLSQSFVSTGEFTILRKIRTAIVENVVMYALMGIVLIILLISALVILQFKIEWNTLPNLAMGASNAYGIILLIALMGYGMIELPRTIWHSANIERQLTYYEYKASIITLQLDEVEEDIIDQLNGVKAADARAPQDLKKFVEKLHKLADKYNEKYKISNISNSPSTKEITYKQLTTLNRKLKNAICQCSKVEYQWEEIQKKAFYLEDVVEAKHSRTRVIASTLRPARTGFLKILNPIEYFWKIYFRTIFLRLLSICVMGLSLFLLYEELILLVMYFVDVDLSPLSLLMNVVSTQRYLQQFICIAFIFYMSYCAHLTLFRIRIFNLYQLVPQHSSAYSILFLAVFLCRIAAPICYNFIRMVKIPGGSKCAFALVYGSGDPAQYFFDSESSYAAPIAYVFIAFNALFILGVVFFAIFRIHDRVFGLFKIKRFVFSGDQESAELAEEGRDILLKERKKKEKILSASKGEEQQVIVYNYDAEEGEARSDGWARRNPNFQRAANKSGKERENKKKRFTLPWEKDEEESVHVHQSNRNSSGTNSNRSSTEEYDSKDVELSSFRLNDSLSDKLKSSLNDDNGSGRKYSRDRPSTARGKDVIAAYREKYGFPNN